MKRWAPWFLLVLGLCGLVFASRSSSPALLEDTDTAALLARIREVRDPLQWFRGDWPLENHFYRPVSTVVFWLDYIRTDPSDSPQLTGQDARVFGQTNALLACCCILMLFWFLREATGSPWLTGVATLLFGVWHLGEAPWRFVAVGVAWLGPLCLLGVLRGGASKLWTCLLACTACVFLSSQVGPVADFSSRIVQWLPGRTASVMTVFALASMACYARYVRLSGSLVPLSATSEDVPATKSSVLSRGGGSELFLCLAGCLVSLSLALGSYEQAVMLPALLFGVWLLFLLRGVRSVWWPHVLFWLFLAAYLVVRHAVLPSTPSAYQEQQFRSGPGVWIAIGDYLVPFVYWAYMDLTSLSVGALIMMTGPFWQPMVASFGNVVAFCRALGDRQWRWTVLWSFLTALVAFLPMAWLQPFGHYHYLPSAFRSLYVVGLCAVVWKLVVSAASLPELRAPARRGPAPGSLLRP